MNHISLLILGCLSINIALAEERSDAANKNWTTRCEPIELYLQGERPDKVRGFVYAGLSKESRLQTRIPFKIKVSTNLHPMFGKYVKVNGLQATLKKAVLIESTKKIKEGSLGKTETTLNTYGVKMLMEAEEPIGFTLHLDIAGPSKTETVFVICKEQTYRFVN